MSRCFEENRSGMKYPEKQSNLLWEQDVAGSNPAAPTTFRLELK